MDVKLIGLAICLLAITVVSGCGEKADANSHQDAPEISKPITAEESMRKRGMSEEEIQREQAARGSSMGGGNR